MIEIENLCCAYEDELVLKDVDLTLPENEFTILAGPNGAGKSTLIYALLGFLKPRKGKVRIFDKPLNSYKRIELAHLVSFVPQESVFQFDYPVRDIVLMGRYPYLGLTQSWMPKDYEAVDRVLEQLSLQAFANRFYSQLSGGEKQRVLIARALAQDTRYIFLDETLSQLDINHQIDIMILLRKILAENKKDLTHFS